ncbi:hypothetical protein HJG60_011361 [Phyllostomus discolor]|uniref:Uncharacterized protein n=1 Tax=Phyllostomus discolor TaxID=89673 RepID=A0A834A7K0_9CHIR|nr:hypothetical protein HJG60_011361 [Phyllostomus discolor]
MLTWKSPLCRWANTRGGRGGAREGPIEEGLLPAAAVRTGAAHSPGLRTQMVKPVPAPGGLHVGWPLEEGVSEVRGAEGSGQMSSGVAGECRYLRPQPLGLDSPHLGTVAARDPTLGTVLSDLVFGKRRHLS